MPTSPSASCPNTPVPDLLGRALARTKGEAVFHHVRREILLGMVSPDEPLLEQRIAATMRCSQGTVREALMRLERDGLVERHGYRGTVVVEPSGREAAEMVRSTRAGGARGRSGSRRKRRACAHPASGPHGCAAAERLLRRRRHR